MGLVGSANMGNLSPFFLKSLIKKWKNRDFWHFSILTPRFWAYFSFCPYLVEVKNFFSIFELLYEILKKNISLDP